MTDPSQPQPPCDHVTLIDAPRLLVGLADANWVLVDCRFSLADTSLGKARYDAGHIPGAHYAHLDRDLSGSVLPGITGRHPLPDVERLAQTFRDWGMHNTSQLIAYDDAQGAIAARLWWLARWLGHTRVAVLDAGFQAYAEAQGAVISHDLPEKMAGSFQARVKAELVIDSQGVEPFRTLPSHRLFDARERPRFLGELEPIDPVAGRIAGARHLPFQDNLKDGRFRPAHELRARFLEALDGAPASKAAVYCGSGVTACHDILAASHAGIEGLKLYAGSYSEWLTDPARPVARG